MERVVGKMGKKVGVEVGERVFKEGAAYEAAKNGGRHHKTYQDYLKKSDKELHKAINSLRDGKRGLNTHLDKIKNPERYYPDWSTFSEARKMKAISDWKREIVEFQEQIDIFTEILKNR